MLLVNIAHIKVELSPYMSNRDVSMSDAHKLDCESVSDTCRFIIQSENQDEAVELAKQHMKEIHGQDLSTEELQNDHLQVV